MKLVDFQDRLDRVLTNSIQQGVRYSDYKSLVRVKLQKYDIYHDATFFKHFFFISGEGGIGTTQ